ncbi:MoaD/ThiS family protein [Kitasatospora sp. NPDC002040]|uniref:MoaD/ThiS family protein n=1 Tax=Kitasatospora sp. NPDC002040 TaxID=3154661 RepID=UPI00332A3C45
MTAHTSTARATAAEATRVTGTIRYWAAAKSAAGLPEEPYLAVTLGEALAEVRRRHADNARLLQVLTHCSYLVDGNQVGTRDHATVPLTEGGTVEALPPFAGG